MSMPSKGPVSDEGIRRVQLTLVTMADIAMACGRYKKGEMVKKKWGARRKWKGPRNVLVATVVDEKGSSCSIFTLLRKGVPYVVTDCRFKYKRIGFSHSP